MPITQNKVVQIHYVLRDDRGEVLDRSKKDAPLAYLHGSGAIVPGLEKALEGRKPGDRFKISIPPEEAYGLRHEQGLQEVPLSEFEPGVTLEVGQQFVVQMSDSERIATVAEIREKHAVLDFNHPLAGQTLHFEIEVADVRDASAEEISHGHIHGEGGHHH